MTRKSRRELERELENLVDDISQTSNPISGSELSEVDKHDARTLLRYRQHVAADIGVHIDDCDALAKLLAVARENVGAGNVTVDALQAAADATGFEPGGTDDA